jgi:hypothetical protein
LGGLPFSFIPKKPIKVLHSKVILSMLLGIIVIGVAQFSFAEVYQETASIVVDIEEFEQPISKYDYQEIIIVGNIPDYSRGQNVTIIIIDPNGTEEEINTFASKKGDIYTFLHITWDSEVGVHEVILKYEDEGVAYTSFEILESQ